MSWNQGHLLKSGQYKVIRLLGSGGFGMTYLAKDLTLERQVVIKRPNLSFEADRDYDQFLRRFKREGQALARVQIPNIVRVIEFIEIERMPCLVMDFVAGETLNECIRRRKFIPENEACQLFQKLASAVETLHQHGIIHCDIHPGNIIVQPNNEPVLIDFGSTKLLHPTTWTVTTTVNKDFGPYEQMAESEENICGSQPAWDIYSLAANMYFAVTGQKPISAISRKLYNDGLKSPKRLQPDLSDQLSQMIMRGMALEGSQRPISIKEWHSPVDKNKIKLIEIFFLQWFGLCLLVLAYLSNGVLVGIYVVNDKITLSLFFSVMGAFFSSAIAADVVQNKINSQKLSVFISSIATYSFAYALSSIESYILGGAMAGAVLFTCIKCPTKKYSLIWLVIFISVSALLTSGFLGYTMKRDTLKDLLCGVAASLNLFSMIAGYHFSRRYMPRERRTMSIFMEYMIFSTISILMGLILGLVLKHFYITNVM